MQLFQTSLYLFLSIWFGLFHENNFRTADAGRSKPYLVLLGTVQDGGSPHIACKKDCCKALFERPDPSRKVISIGLIDPLNKQDWMIEATPDLPMQMKLLKKHSGFEKETPDGIFITHAHIGHYAGLMYLGREAMNADKLPVYAMPKMKSFLEGNGPWSQLLTLNNIRLFELENEKETAISSQLQIMPFIVPHRDEFSETVGYLIKGPNKKALFIPDIDKWAKWEKQIVDEIGKVDYALIDATFFDADELNGRSMAEIPHPFVMESMVLFEKLGAKERNKIYFIHFNHTNPLLNLHSKQAKEVLKKGFHIGVIGQELEL